ncbi:CAP domain protein [Cordyceps fumosorosea ARSEF 2679]|uniref:CAP domain protein n=1 Tax=Cordyceps fumosorosea (strain ARSEF 2679) TaxID=1081104 RepID=A0A167LB00_CORFA|nr:CAP domain protein [Cordyceps fumosorosea ARSEF 2679]OAA52866.1 CAP domain protein [Cordyceps fumosorosea ARSEF 2679]
MHANVFSKAAILAMAAVASTAPVSAGEGDVEARQQGNFVNFFDGQNDFFKKQIFDEQPDDFKRPGFDRPPKRPVFDGPPQDGPKKPTPGGPKEKPAPEAPKEKPAPEAPKEKPAPEAPKPKPAPEAPKEKPAPGGDFKKQILDAQNWYRAQHSAPPLEWDDKLAQNAQAWASKCSENPRHQPSQPHGENIAWGTGERQAGFWANLWGNERVKYSFDAPSFTGETGHFTQLVWKSTTKVGCAEAKCNYGTNVVCEYDPAGNVMGGSNFKNNVLPQTSGKVSDQYPV